MLPVPIDKALSFSQMIDDVQVDNDLLYFSCLKENGQISLFALSEGKMRKKFSLKNIPLALNCMDMGDALLKLKEESSFLSMPKIRAFIPLIQKGFISYIRALFLAIFTTLLSTTPFLLYAAKKKKIAL